MMIIIMITRINDMIMIMANRIIIIIQILLALTILIVLIIILITIITIIIIINCIYNYKQNIKSHNAANACREPGDIATTKVTAERHRKVSSAAEELAHWRRKARCPQNHVT